MFIGEMHWKWISFVCALAEVSQADNKSLTHMPRPAHLPALPTQLSRLSAISALQNIFNKIRRNLHIYSSCMSFCCCCWRRWSRNSRRKSQIKKSFQTFKRKTQVNYVNIMVGPRRKKQKDNEPQDEAVRKES